MECLPDAFQKKIQRKNRTPLEERKHKTVLNYSSHVKLRAVIRWKERMVRNSITTERLADYLDIPSTRISEYLNFTWEPNQERFEAIEAALYKLGA